MDSSFAFVIHPIDPQRDVGRKFPALGRLPRPIIEALSVVFPPVVVSRIRGVRSAVTDVVADGWIVACPLTSSRLMRLPLPVVYHKIAQTGRLAERLGARLLGLGAFTSVVGDAGITVARRLSIPVTTGNSLTVAMAARAIRRAAERLGQPLPAAVLAVVGATGSIGGVCAELLAPNVAGVRLIGRRPEALEGVAARVRAAGCRDVTIATTLDGLRDAHLVISVSSALETLIEPGHLRPGAVVLDVARPRDVSRQVASARPDVLVIEGGMVAVPGPPDFGFDFGFPPSMAYACMAETMTLALERRFEPYTLGRAIDLGRVQQIDDLAALHGFALGGFRSFERAVTDSEVEAVRRRSHAVAPALVGPAWSG